jgi:LuxR family transcriptional regulator, maltose regulon positive regulatory protein
MAGRVSGTGTPPLLETKLAAPRVRAAFVVRERLFALLDGFASAALTLVDAPVGFGKTVLVQSWCTARPGSALAWVSLDADDDDPVRLWTYVAGALERVRPGLGRPALARALTAGMPVSAVCDEIVNGMAAYDGALTVVLDDLHRLSDREALDSVQRVAELLPANARIVATTRHDPAMELGRLRARGLLGEVRSHDLAFTVDEAAELLVGHEGLRLGADDVRLLVERTEGWPAGLYLAALWLRDQSDPSAVVCEFAGNHRHVADYLGGEVLDAVDPAIGRFLLRTSVLERFSAPLCDALLDRDDSRQTIAFLERSNLFVVPLDAHGEWFRYHHLFGDLLRLELERVDPSALPTLHVRASSWYRERGLVEEALHHAEAAGDRAHVAEILAAEAPSLVRSGRAATVLSRVESLPAELLWERPELPTAAALAAGLLNRPFERRRYLGVALQVSEEEPERWQPYHELLAGIVRSAWMDGDVSAAVEHGRRAAEIARNGVGDVTVGALAALANALYLEGDLDGAYAAAGEAVERPEAVRPLPGVVHALGTMSLVETERGRVREALELARRGVVLAAEAGFGDTWLAGNSLVALGAALTAAGRAREAERSAAQGEFLRRGPEPSTSHVHALLVLAEAHIAAGRLERAAAAVDEAATALAAFPDAGRLPDLAAAAVEALRIAGEELGGVEQPTPAERAVLRLLPTDLSLREIGNELFLSVNTVKSHTRELYRKLRASSRAEAVTRATAHGLLESGEPALVEGRNAP